MFKAQKRSKEINEIVHVTSVVQLILWSYENTFGDQNNC